MTKGRENANLLFVCRLLVISILAVVLVLAAGCNAPTEQEKPIWEQTSIHELAPQTGERPRAKILIAGRFDIHVFNLPADNVEQLEDLWRILSAKPIHTNSYSAFARNLFRVRLGRMEMWDRLMAVLAEAGAQRGGTTTLGIVSDGPTDLPIAELPRAGTISHAAMNLSWERAPVQPGRLVLRLQAEPIPGARGVRKIVAYPVSSPAITSAIPQLEAKTREQEFHFASAAFASQMGPGDLLVLGPNVYSAERMTLGGLFFNEPRDVVFFNPETSAPPQRKPAVRVFVLVCLDMID